jgi:hypothetical protein
MSILIKYCEDDDIREEIWYQFISEADNKLRDNDTCDDTFEALLNISTNCKYETYSTECWRILSKYEYGNETYLEIVLENNK